MRLFVRCYSCHRKIFILYIVESRNDLPSVIDVRCPFEDCSEEFRYSPYDVEAETGVLGGVAGALAGALLGGLVAGPLGLLLGGALGATAGASADEQDLEHVRRFNEG